MAIECIDASVFCVLENLLSTCREGKDLYLFAAENTCDNELKALFTQHAHEKVVFATELEDEICRLGGEVRPATAGSTPVLARWPERRATTEQRRADALLSVCGRGEERALEKYYQALTLDLPEDCYHLIERQFDAVKQAHDEIYALD